MIKPFIEVAILDNCDSIVEFLADGDYTFEEVYAIITKDEDMDGVYAEIRLHEDDELLCVTASWSNKLILKRLLLECISEDLIFKDSFS